MKGTIVRHERSEHRDESTGHTVKQLTSLAGNHHHLYFTSNSFTADNRHVLLISDYGGGHPNLFKLSIEDGEAVQLTDNREGFMKSYVYYDGNPYRGLAKASPSYNPDHGLLLYIQGNDVRLLNVDSLEEETVYRLPNGVMTGFTHLSSDGKYACVPYIDAKAFEVGHGNQFQLIRDKVKRERIESHLLVIDTATGKGAIWGSQVGWITHVQFHPDHPHQILYNHEGGKVDQRIWLSDNGNMHKIRDQSVETEPIWICHEMWMQHGDGVLYHGTIRVPKDPATQGMNEKDVVSFVGYFDMRSGNSIEIPFPREMKAYGHFTASSDDQWLVTDGVIDGKCIYLCQPQWENKRVTWTKVCEHNSSFCVQDVHPHPIFSHDDRYVMFTTDAYNRKGQGHLHLIDLTEICGNVNEYKQTNDVNSIVVMEKE